LENIELTRNRKVKPDDWYRQSAAIPWFSGADGSMKIVLVTSRKRKRWIVPKGIVDSGLSPAESAAKECFEEAGVVGEITSVPVGVYESRKWGGVCRIEVFPFLVIGMSEDWPESSSRKRIVVDAGEARRRITHPGLRSVLAAFLASRDCASTLAEDA
jgi:8-oxo-dGTP pyrophosphatase MutT (NUDIX family)